MKSAQELKNSKNEKLQQRLKENTERINMELVEIEKAQNKWESDLEDKKPYFEIPILIKTKEVKTLLVEQGDIIDKVSNDIKVNTSRIYLDQETYRIAVHKIYTMSNDNKQDNCKNDFSIDIAGLNKADYPTTVEDWINGLKNLREIKRRMCY